MNLTPVKQLAAIHALEACDGYAFYLAELDREIAEKSETALDIKTDDATTRHLKWQIVTLRETRNFIERRKASLRGMVKATAPEVPQ